MQRLTSFLMVITSTLVLACGSASTGTPTTGEPTNGPSTSTMPSCQAVALDHAIATPLGGEASDTECALASLDPVVGEAQVICSAEYSHGVAESAVIHAALIRHFVKVLGYRTIAFEVDDAVMRSVDAYVNAGDEARLTTFARDVGQTLANSKDSVDLFRALRALKLELSESEKLSIRGIDVAIQLGATQRALLDYLAIVGPTMVAAWSPKLKTTDPALGQTNASEFRQLLTDHKQDFVARSNEASFALADWDAEALADGYGFLQSYQSSDFNTGNANYRDPAMARGVLRLAQQGQKIVVLTHLGHCAKDFPSSGMTRASGHFGFGKAVHDALGKRYHVIAQLFGSGEEMLPSGVKQRFTPSPKSLENALLEHVETTYTLLPVRGKLPIDLDQEWALSRLREELLVPTAQADVLFFIKPATPTTLNWR